jgi:hypothetical protein
LELEKGTVDSCCFVFLPQRSQRVFELVNVANIANVASSNVANFQLGIGIGVGNIFTLATFTPPSTQTLSPPLSNSN